MKDRIHIFFFIIKAQIFDLYVEDADTYVCHSAF